MRADPQNLPAAITPRWPGSGYAGFGGGDHGSAYVERTRIYDFVAKHGITGFATVAGDRHSFWAGRSAKDLPSRKFEPVGVAFITSSISAPGIVESLEHKFPKAHALRELFVADQKDAAPKPAINLLLHHGVRTCFEYAHSGDIARAKAQSIATFRRTWISSTWAGTGIRSCARRRSASKLNLSVSRVRSNAAPPVLERHVIEGEVEYMT